MCIRPDSNTACCIHDQSHGAHLNTYHCCLLQLLVLVVVSSVCGQCRLSLCCINLQPSPTSPFNDCCSILLKLRDNLVEFASGGYPATFIQNREFFGWDILFDWLDKSWCVDCQWIADAGEPCRTPTSTGYLVMALCPIIISTILSERIHSVHHTMSLSIACAFSSFTSSLCAMLPNAVLPSMRGTPARFQFVYTVCTLF